MDSKVINTGPSTIETIDGAILDYVEELNLHCNTVNGWNPVPVIWSSAERSYQIKNNRQLRDKNGALIPPIISLERVSSVKDPQKKGSFQANVSPKNDRYIIRASLRQDKTSNFANADALKKSGQINFITSKKNKKQVYEFQALSIPVYITVEYKINIITNYQAQMNEIVQPFMSKTGQNYFLIKKDGYNYECFMDQNFEQESIANLGEEERKYKTSIKIKVLGYLIGEGENQDKATILKGQNAVELKFPKENIAIVQEEPRKQKEAPTLLRNAGVQKSSSVALKKIFLIGNGIDSVYTLQHNLNTRDMYISVREEGGDYAKVEVAVDFTDLNNVLVDMGDIIPNDSYVVTIIG